VVWISCRFVAVGDAGTVLSSAAGFASTTRQAPTSQNPTALAGGPRPVAGGADGAVARSPDGASWTPEDSGTDADLNEVSKPPWLL
jgi:hypothetical protein